MCFSTAALQIEKNEKSYDGKRSYDLTSDWIDGKSWVTSWNGQGIKGPVTSPVTPYRRASSEMVSTRVDFICRRACLESSTEEKNGFYFFDSRSCTLKCYFSFESVIK